MRKLAATVVLGLGLFGSMAGCRSTDAPQALSECTVEGCVERPGPIGLDDDSTVLEVVMAAGPIEDRSDLEHVQLVRPGTDGGITMRINLAEMLQTGDSTFNVLVQPGDVLTVPEKKR